MKTKVWTLVMLVALAGGCGGTVDLGDARNGGTSTTGTPNGSNTDAPNDTNTEKPDTATRLGLQANGSLAFEKEVR